MLHKVVAKIPVDRKIGYKADQFFVTYALHNIQMNALRASRLVLRKEEEYISVYTLYLFPNQWV